VWRWGTEQRATRIQRWNKIDGGKTVQRIKSRRWPACTGKSQPESARDEENTPVSEPWWGKKKGKATHIGGSQMKNEVPAYWNKEVCKDSISTARRK
jgi:hypothetical protein